MNDTLFVGGLVSAGLLPGDIKASVAAKKATADKADEFLTRIILPEFCDDGSTNESLEKLLEQMKNSDHVAVRKLAREFEFRGS